MDLNSVELFVAAAQAGSISEAARRTAVPLPTLSRRLRKLEDDLGMRLLERGPKGLALTPAGTQLMADAKPALMMLAQAEQRLHDASGVAGILRVSLPPHFDPMWPVFAEFGRRYPAVRFDVFVTDRRVDLVADGVDVVIRVGEGGYGVYVGRTITRYRHRVVAAPTLLQGVVIQTPADLRQVPSACWRSPGRPSWTMGDQRVDLEPQLITNDYQHLLQVAIAGQAVVEVPPFLASAPLRDGRLIEVLPSFPMPQQSIRALVGDARALSPLLRRFLDFVASTDMMELDELDDV